MHALAIAAMVAQDFSLAAETTSEWNRFHPHSRWSYVKNSLMLSLDAQCEAALRQGHKVEDLVNGNPSVFMDAWIAWGYHNCGAVEDHARSTTSSRAQYCEPGSINYPIDPHHNFPAGLRACYKAQEGRAKCKLFDSLLYV